MDSLQNIIVPILLSRKGGSVYELGYEIFVTLFITRYLETFVKIIQNFVIKAFLKKYAKIVISTGTYEGTKDSAKGIEVSHDWRCVSVFLSDYAHKHSLDFIETNFYDRCGQPFTFITFSKKIFIPKYKIYVSTKDNDPHFEIILETTPENSSIFKTFVKDSIQFYKEIKRTWEPSIIHFPRNNISMWEKIDFNTNKSFDNMFFDEKEHLIQRLDHFMNGQERYKKLGIPYTLGMCLHGTAGTGKTSAIKAIASYMKRNIVLVPIRLIFNMTRLEDVFSEFDVRTCIFVFEEIDCGNWENVVRSRFIASERETSKKSKKKKDDDSDSDDEDEKCTLKLSELLEFMDGIREMSGRVIIMTTNRMDYLDPALLRPGRIDMVIEFKKMNKKNISDMYRLWFGEGLPRDTIKNIKDYKFSQAEIGQLFSTLDKHKIVNELTR